MLSPSSQEALIHLGAKFSPCMRQDPQVHSFILAAREREKHSACCVRNDRSGCVQTSKEECSVGVLSCCPLLSLTEFFTGFWRCVAPFTLAHRSQFLWMMLM